MRPLLLLIAVGGCHCGNAKPEGAPSTKGARSTESVPATPSLAENEFYRLDLAGEPACTLGTPCEVKVALTALAGHHVNAEYPTKFVPDASPDASVEGTGAFTVERETRGVMSIRVTPSKAGTFTLHGQFRLSVCTNNSCEIEGPKIALPIHAT